jgi:FtsP/CotA-like multicopper oxidase with cupredoxin domain
MRNDERKERPAMRSLALKKIRALVVLVSMAGLYSAVTTAPASAASVSVYLCATTGTATMPGAVSVPIWGFVQTGSATCVGASGNAQIPGPVLDVNDGDEVTVTVTNDLPGAHAASFELPGLSVIPSGATYSFTATRPGTFVYQSPGDAGRQMAMGLYGALIVRPTSALDTPIPGQAYGSPSSAYDAEATLVLSAIDPVFNASPDTFNMHDYLATYWLINGKAYSSSPSESTDPIHATAGQKLLLRYVNAGFDNTTMMLLGLHEHVIARDAYELSGAFDADAETFPAGETEDAIATIPASSSGLPNGFPLFNRQLHLTNGAPGASPGGQMTFIVP